MKIKPVERAKPFPDSVMFLDYITTDEDGNMNGVRNDAPEWAKKQYKEYTDRYERNLRKGILI